MNLFGQHPATRRLLQQQSRARFARALHGFRTTRRALLSLFALVLSVIWISQGIAGVFLRDAADPVRLYRWLALGLTGFALWNLIKVTFRQPVEPFEWSDAEKEWLCAAPLSRRDLIRYRLGGISAAAMFKATIFVGVMIPDLHFWALAFIGLYIGLMMIEVLRMGMEVLVFGMTCKQRIALQTFVGALLLVVIAISVNWYIGQWDAGKFSSVVSLAFWNCTREGLQLIPQTAVGEFVCWPFGNLVARVVLADQLHGLLLARFVCSAGLLWGMIHQLQRLDRAMHGVRQKREKQNWNYAFSARNQQAVAASRSNTESDASRRIAPRGGAMGALIWRQFEGLRFYLGTVLFSLVMPMFFALGPAFGPQKDWPLVQVLVLVLGFWSFFLLPAALKFDFRRDLNRINVLKALPMKPWQVVIAQLVVPVGVTTLFQLVTLLVAMLFNPYSPVLLLVAMAILLPFNIFVYALENLIFLLYPYRITEESIRVFLRTILAFTAKGVVLGVIAAIWLLLMLGSVLLCRGLQVNDPQSISLIIFAIASLLLGMFGSGATIALLARTFDKLDPSQDLSTAVG